MTEKIQYIIDVDSCETCPGGLKEPHGLYRCKHNIFVEFKQNQQTGIPDGCPFKKPDAATVR